MMTRKDFQAIADALQAWNVDDLTRHLGFGESNEAQANYVRRDVALALAEKLAESNPRFDRAKFLDAAGPRLPESLR